MSSQKEDKPIIDLSSDDAKKQTFRKLLCGTIVAFFGSVAVSIFGQLPEAIQMAVDLENETVPPWKATIEFVATLVLLGVTMWSFYQLWKFQSAGLFTLALATFAPYFLVQTTASTYTPLADYLTSVQSALSGMVLCMGWAFPGILTAPAGTDANADTRTSGNAQGAQAQ
jgi:hypothetical protein